MATSDASLVDAPHDLSSHLCWARSARQRVAAGGRYVFIPGMVFRKTGGAAVAPVVLDGEPAPPEPFDVLVEELALAGACAEISIVQDQLVFDAGAAFLCCLGYGHDGDHGWPDLQGRERMAAAFLEQMDPTRRLDRRLAFELEQMTTADDVAFTDLDLELLGYAGGIADG